MIDFLEGKKRYIWLLMALSALALVIPLSLNSLKIININPGSPDGIIALIALMIIWLLFFFSFYVLMTVDAFSTRAFRRDRLTRRGTFAIWLILTVIFPVVIYAVIHDWLLNF